MSAASDRGLKKGARTLLQTIAGGGLTALVTVIAGGLDPAVQAIVMAALTALTALVQNYLETSGAIATILPTRTTVSAVSGGLTQATVGAVIEDGGEVVGDVLDLAGDVVGKVTGQVDPDFEDLGEKGGIGKGLAIFVVVVLLAMGACLAIADDNDDEDGLAPRGHRQEQGDDRENTGSKDKGRDSRGDCEGSTNCDERDFSPELTDSPVTICMPQSTCNFGEDESAGAPVGPPLREESLPNASKGAPRAAPPEYVNL